MGRSIFIPYKKPDLTTIPCALENVTPVIMCYLLITQEMELKKSPSSNRVDFSLKNR